ncbi:MAG: hypothetical protein IPH13_06385 [Planctomycetes bacterium]|nr:hypothetical protein [Planctomycetota bacterium]MCC7169085.1 hypothetical protein [Planctomycetota bacterium]
MLRRLGLVVAASIFFAVVLAVPCYELAGGVWPGSGLDQPFSSDAIRRGEWAKAVERDLSRHERVPGLIRGTYNEFMFRSFQHTPHEVLLGADGWFFLGASTRDFPVALEKDALPRTAELVASTVRWFERNGTKVVVLFVPEKSSLLPDQVRATEPTFRPMYDASCDAFRAHGLGVIDPRPVLTKDGRLLYHKNDTHWTSEGAVAAARLAADRIVEHYGGADAVPGAVIAGEITENAPRRHVGDLVKMLGLKDGGELELSLGVMTSTIVGREPKTQAILDSKESEDVVLVGTSYSHGYYLPSVFSALLHRRVENRAIIGRGPIVPLLQVAQDSLLKRRAFPRLMIWEVPERFLFVSAERDLRPPLENLLRATQYDPSTEVPLSADPGPVSNMRMTKVEAGEFDAVASSAAPQFTLRLREPIVGDGSRALVFEVRAPTPTMMRVHFDVGNGIDGRTKFESWQIGFDAEQIMVVPLLTPDHAPIRALRIDPITVQAPFHVGRIRLWSEAQR